nr:hypothetical protein [Nitrosomonas nitrosa]
MNANEIAHKEAVQRIKEAIYDLQLGEAEIVPSDHAPDTYRVRFDNRAGGPGEVFIHASERYEDMIASLRRAHDSIG